MRLNATALLITALGISPAMYAQDRIYTTKGDTFTGKIMEVWDTYIKYQKTGAPSGPYYVIRLSKIDSIIYADGHSEDIVLQLSRRRKPNHLTSNNTIAFDFLGPVSQSMTMWYERRVWNGRIGIRIPVYLCYGQNYSPGFHGMRIGRKYIDAYDGFACATGINPKFYFNKHKIFRVFAGPEADIGYTRYADVVLRPYRNRRDFSHIFNLQLAGMAGININPFARFNLTIEGGAGYTAAFYPSYKNLNPT
ncbi:MAG TPA: hypothetical protein VK154_13000, partial [Chitinophagales bacterium]|nr:hypothetical protein [Chitinophagales bacterium]